MLEVDLEALLVAVQAYEVRGLSAATGTPGAGMSWSHTLRAELGAEVAEHGGTEWARQRMAEVEDLHVFKRQLHRVSS
jgi:hypothetical protein